MQLVPNGIKEEFTECKDMEILARGIELERILKEVRFEQSLDELFNPDDVVKMGELVGANYIITGTILKSMDGIKIRSEIIDMRKGVVVLKNHVIVDDGDISKAISVLSSQMLAKISKVKITEIVHSKIDYTSIEVKGKNTCIPNGWEIWISVLPSGCNKHHPQTAATIQGNEWLVPCVSLGERNKESDDIRQFHIYALLVEPTTHELFKKYIEEAVYSGVDLPPSVIICDKKVTKRKKILSNLARADK